MKNIQLKSLVPHLISVLVFVFITLVYFSPLLKGEKLKQSDIVAFKGMSKEIVDHRVDYDEDPLWSNSMFSGMPAYQISVLYTSNLIKKFSSLFRLYLPNPSGYVFLYLLGFYFLLVSLSIDYRLAIVGAIAFAFSSYFFIIIEAGHNTKAHAIGYLAPVLASVLMVYRGKILLGGVLTALFTSLMISANHFQITYYLVVVLVIIGLVNLFYSIKNKELNSFFKRVAILILAGSLGLLTNITSFLTTTEYGAESMRGQSELTSDINNKTSGLDKNYATSWSYGIAESFTLLIPNFHGGASGSELTTDSQTYKELSKRTSNAKQLIKQLPMYWGEQPFTSGPVYAGAIAVFLFILGLTLISPITRVWILSSFILMLALSWGKHFMPLTDFFLDYVPGYNKFRAVSTTLVIVELLIPFVAILGLQKIVEFSSENKDLLIKKLAVCSAIVASICLIFIFSKQLLHLMPEKFFDFVASGDAQLKTNGWPVDAIQADRVSMMVSDAWRSLILILLSAGAIYLFLANILKKNLLIVIIGVLILGDMWMVNKRYLNDDNFLASKKIEQPFKKSIADQQILQDKDINYRVYNTTVSPFNDATTSYYHKSIGGYHGAKLKRYQELIDKYLSKGQINVFNMLNTKYFIINGQNNSPVAQLNRDAYGNAWFVKEVIKVENADQEIDQIGLVDLKSQAVVDKRFDYSLQFQFDSLASINLTSYKANHLVYQSNASSNQFAVFSEVFYDKGWNAYLNGELVPHYRANYVLRAMNIPAGENKVEFKFEPQTFKTGQQISLASSIILLLLILGVAYKEFK
jgi:hypothetical protein